MGKIFYPTGRYLIALSRFVGVVRFLYSWVVVLVMLDSVLQCMVFCGDFQSWYRSCFKFIGEDEKFRASYTELMIIQ